MTMATTLSSIARLAIIVGLGIFHPLTQNSERRLSTVLCGNKPIACRAEHGRVRDLVLGRRQFIRNLV